MQTREIVRSPGGSGGATGPPTEPRVRAPAVHCWNHRRFVAACAGVPVADELAFTSEKIAQNFSNYSAWHYRAQLLEQLRADPAHATTAPSTVDELQLVRNAYYTEPADQSAWFYQHWLLRRADAALGMVQMRVDVCDTDGCRADVIIVLDTTAPGPDARPALELRVDGTVTPPLEPWAPIVGALLGDPSCSPMWRCSVCVGAEWRVVEVHGPGIAGGLQVARTDPAQRTVTAYRAVPGTAADQPPAAAADVDVLETELASCQALLDMEEGERCRWPMYATVALLRALGGATRLAEAIRRLETLAGLDPLRRGHYDDVRSDLVIELACIAPADQQPSSGLLSLTDVRLTRTARLERIPLHVHTLDLSRNLLCRLHGAHFLVQLSELRLDRNRLRRITRDLARLPRLTLLSLCDNLIEDWDALSALGDARRLRVLNIAGNPVCRQAVDGGWRSRLRLLLAAVPLERIDGFTARP